jgi:hypothetical protein
MESKSFSGPDGTSDTFFTASNRTILSFYNDSRWTQYRAYLLTDNIFLTPSLKSVMIQYNLLQNITLSSPSGGDNWTGIQNITWSAHDIDNDSLSFDLYLENGSSVTPLVSGLANDTKQWSWNTNTTPNGTYRIRIAAIDDNPLIPLTITATSNNFTIHHPGPPPPPNHLPHITSLPPAMATVGVEYFYNVSAVDPDNDTLTYTLDHPPVGMSIDPISGRVSWTPSTTGTFTITVMVSDGHGGNDNQTFSIVVSPGSRPICIITSHMNDSTISGTINIAGSAVKGTLPLERVEVRIDGGEWKPATGLESWKLVLDTRTLTNGQHTIEARAFGGQLYSDNVTVTITVNNISSHVIPPNSHTNSIDQYPWSILLVIFIAIGVMVVLHFRSRRRFTE